MAVKEIKYEIQKDIDKINDAELLGALKIFIETHLLNPYEPKFTDEQIRRLELSRDQSKKGEYFTNEEVDREIDEWLKEKE